MSKFTIDFESAAFMDSLKGQDVAPLMVKVPPALSLYPFDAVPRSWHLAPAQAVPSMPGSLKALADILR